MSKLTEYLKLLPNKKIGIYIITNVVNNKSYVGSTILCIRSRIRVHIFNLENCKHHSIKLQRAWDKYGADSFKVDILEEVQPENILLREQFWIDSLDTFNNGYNCRPKAENNKGKRVSPETRKKLSIINKGKRPKYILTDHDIDLLIERTRRPVFQYSVDGYFIKEWKSIKEASMTLFNKKDSGISSVMDKEMSYKRFQWKSEYVGETIAPYKRTNRKEIKVYMYNEEGLLINTFQSVKEASEITGISRQHICSICKGKRCTDKQAFKYE